MRGRAVLGGSLALALACADVARAQGVAVEVDGTVQCVLGDDGHAVAGASCGDLSCPAPRACVQVDGGARCFDPATEIVCVPGDGGCEACPIISTGADPEVCRVVTLADGPHSLCLYHTSLVCLADPAFALDLAACLAGPDPDSAGLSLEGGDCDGDGTANATDRCLCEAGPSTSAGCGPALDGSVVELDAALPDRDAAVERDAQIPLDAAPPDSMAPDSMAPDSAPTPPPGASFRGGGGCACAIDRRERPVGLALAPALLLALAIRRRRRSLRTALR